MRKSKLEALAEAADGGSDEEEGPSKQLVGSNINRREAKE